MDQQIKPVVKPTPDEIRAAREVLTLALNTDPELAWAWHCNIAMPISDCGVPHSLANRAAARVIGHVLEHDITSNQHYSDTQPLAVGDYENSLGEAVAHGAINGFASWLTTRNETMTASRTHDAAPMAEAVAEYCDMMKIGRACLTDGWADVARELK